MLWGGKTYRTVRAWSSIGAPEIRPAGTTFSSLPSWTFLGTGVKVLCVEKTDKRQLV